LSSEHNDFILKGNGSGHLSDQGGHGKILLKRISGK